MNFSNCAKRVIRLASVAAILLCCHLSLAQQPGPGTGQAQEEVKAVTNNFFNTFLDWVVLNYANYSGDMDAEFQSMFSILLERYKNNPELMTLMRAVQEEALNNELENASRAFFNKTGVRVYCVSQIDDPANRGFIAPLNRVLNEKLTDKAVPHIIVTTTLKGAKETGYTITLSVEASPEINKGKYHLNATIAANPFFKLSGQYENRNAFGGAIRRELIAGITKLTSEFEENFLPNIMVRYDGNLYKGGETIEVSAEPNRHIELIAVNKEGNTPARPVTWTFNPPDSITARVVISGERLSFPGWRAGNYRITTSAGSDRAEVTLKITNLRQMLKQIIIDVLSAKKQEAVDTLDVLRRDSVANAAQIQQYLANLEAGNFPMEPGSTFSPLLAAPIAHPESENFFTNNETRASFNALKKRKRIKDQINRKLNLVAVADLVVDHPDRVDDLAEQLLRNSGALLARLLLGNDTNGPASARNVVLQFVNDNIESLAGGSYRPEDSQIEPLQIPVRTPQPKQFVASKYLYYNERITFPGKQELIDSLNAVLPTLNPPLYVFINYSHDVSVESYLARASDAKPKGIPDGIRYKVFTVVHMPGSIEEMVFGGCGIQNASQTRNTIASCLDDDELHDLYGDDYLFSNDNANEYEACYIFLNPLYKPVIVPKLGKMYVNRNLPEGVLSSFETFDGNEYYKALYNSGGVFQGYFKNGDWKFPYNELAFCNAVTFSGNSEVRILTLDVPDCKISYKKGIYNFSASNLSISYDAITNIETISITVLEDGACTNVAEALVAEAWNPSGIDLTLIDSKKFKEKEEQWVTKFANKIDEAIRAYPTSRSGLYQSSFYHVINAHLLPQDQKNLDYTVIEHKLEYLKEQTGVEFFIIIDNVDFYFQPDQARRNSFAKKVFEKSINLKGRTNVVLVTIPYCKIEKLQATGVYDYVMPGIYYEDGLVDNRFLESTTFRSIAEMVSGAYRWISKPHRQYLSFLNADGTITHSQIFSDRVKGKDCINCVGFFKNVGFDSIRMLHPPNRYQEQGVDRIIEVEDYPIQLFLYSARISDILEQSKTNPEWWTSVSSRIFIEPFVEQYYREYAFKLAFNQSDLSKWWTELRINFQQAEGPGGDFLDLDKACYSFSKLAVIDPIIYGVIDITGLIPVVDNFADAAGLMYATARLDIPNITNYTIGMASVGVGTLAIKIGGTGIKALYKGGVWIVEETGKGYRRLSRVESLRGPLCRMVNIADEGLITSQLLEGIEQLAKSNKLSKRYLNEVLKHANDVEKVSALQRIVELERQIDNLPAAARTTLRNDLGNSNLFAKFVERPELVDSWKRAFDLFPTGSKFITDIPTLERISKLAAEGSTFRAKLGSNWSQALDDILNAAKESKCSNCGNAGRVGRSSIDQYLDDAEFFIANFNVQQGGKGEILFNWMRGRTQSGPVTHLQNLSTQLDEVHQTLRDFAKRGIKESDVRGMGQAFDVGKPGAALKEYDLRLVNNIYTEYKNVDFASNPLINQSQSVDQFINGYLRNIDSFDKFQWKAGFDKLKSAWGSEANALTEMKEQWKVVFQSKADEIFDVIWDNQNLRNNLFQSGLEKADIKPDFLDMISNTNNSFFNFIKVE